MKVSLLGNKYLGCEIYEQTDIDLNEVYENLFNDGDSVTVIKYLKVRGSSGVIKRGTMVRNIRLTDFEGKVEKTMMVLKTEFLKKA
ncbi:PhnA domain-containing protein [Aquirufa ecclesiirivi]